MRSFLTELATGDARFVVDNFFGESGIFQSPETEQTRLKFAVVSAVDVKFTIANNN
jgi:hypothetical protein